MGFDEGRIVLNQENGCYYSGQTVHGKLIFDQEKVKKFRGIFAKFKGFCKVHWTTSHSKRVNKQTVRYTVSHDSHEEYINQETYLLGKDHDEYTLQPGHHELPFQFTIPFNSPSSFEGTYGHIRYDLKLVVNRAFKIDQEKKVSVRVIAPKDLNMDPYAKESMMMEFNKSYHCCCTSRGDCESVVKLPVSGYCPGQVMPVEVSCSNNSRVDIEKIKFKIKKEVTFHANINPSTRWDEDTILEIKKGPVPAHTTRNWTFEIEVPAMDVSDVSSCRYIDVDYKFKVEFVAEGCHRNNDDSRRIVFGIIPLQGFQDNVQNPLTDQMPQHFPQPIINQPLANSPYPGNAPYPGGNFPYPGDSAPYPGGNAPYPGGNAPYPGGNTPYPGGNAPYPGGNAPYPGGNAPYPGGNAPYPGGNAPYPGGHSPYPGSAQPYNPTVTSPYPGDNPPPYPGTTASPFPEKPPIDFDSSSKTAPPIPTLPMGAALPYPPSPFATASAPEPATPDNDGKKMPFESSSISSSPPYNPNFDKKDDEKK